MKKFICKVLLKYLSPANNGGWLVACLAVLAAAYLALAYRDQALVFWFRSGKYDHQTDDKHHCTIQPNHCFI